MLRNRAPRLTDDVRSTRAADSGVTEIEVPDDVLLALTSHVTLLLMGSNRRVARTLDAMRRFLPQPVFSAPGGGRLVLPAEGAGGTLLVSEVGALNGHDQRLLDDWLREGRGAGIQIVSTTTQLLTPLMREGIFNEGLYYQLNTVCVDLDEV